MKTEEEIIGKAFNEYGDDIHLFAQQREGFIEGYKQALSDIQEEKQKGVEELRKEFKKTLFKPEIRRTAEPKFHVTIDDLFNFFLPYLQPAQESDAVEFATYLEDNGWSCVWSNKYKTRRWTTDDVLVNGSQEYYDNLVKNGADIQDIYQEFKLNHKK